MQTTTELLAGRELDALIAEKVMGFTHVGTQIHVQGEDLFGEHDDFWEWIPSYSTDIAAAWKVVERLISQGWRWNLYKTESDGWLVDTGKEPHAAGGEGMAETAPLAICRAALATISG